MQAGIDINIGLAALVHSTPPLALPATIKCSTSAGACAIARLWMGNEHGTRIEHMRTVLFLTGSLAHARRLPFYPFQPCSVAALKLAPAHCLACASGRAAGVRAA